MSRYQIVPRSQSCHCCFEATVVDTSKPAMHGSKPYAPGGVPQYESVCECFDMSDAELIAAALNAKQPTP